MLKIIPLLLIVSFVPVFAQESISINRTDELQNQVNELTIQLNDLKNHNMDLDTHIRELENKITLLEDHGIKFGIDENKLGKAIADNQNPETRWTEGDLIISSTTIFAFFGFGSFLAIRFRQKFQQEQVKLAKKALLNILSIQVLHLYVIMIILIGIFNYIHYLVIIIGTAYFLIRLVKNVMNIIRFENDEQTYTTRGTKTMSNLETEVKTMRISDPNLQTVLDDIKRDYLRREREMGE